MSNARILQDHRSPIQQRLAALWTSLMFLFVYGDYFGLYEKVALMEMNDGVMGTLGAATPQVMIGVSAMMAIPSLMIFGSLVLTPRISRALNVVFGVAYTLIMVATFAGASVSYQFFASIEVVLTATITVMAFRWPGDVE